MGSGREGSGRIDAANLWKILKSSIEGNAEADGVFQGGMPELTYHRHECPEMPVRHFMRPVLIVIAQGSKFVRIGKEDFVYPEGSFFISAVDMPVTSCVIEASKETPYLSVAIDLDMDAVASFAAKLRPVVCGEHDAVMGAAGHRMDAELLDAVIRLIEISRSPEDAACLKQGILAEIHYRLLKSECGCALYALCSLGLPMFQMRNIIGWIKENYRRPFTIMDISEKFCIAPSTIHKHFKTITSLSPIQYQKMLRLSEARRLLAGGNMKVADVAEMLGYESPTQFSREYKRLHGISPRDAKRR